MKRFFITIFAFFLCFVFVCCDNTQDKIEFNIIGEDEVEVDKTITLSHDYDGDKTVSWNISDNNIALIDNGSITGLKPGEVTVSLTIDDVVKEKEIKVVVSSIEIIISGNKEVFIGETISLSASTSFETTEKIQWSTSNENIATVDDFGVVTGLTIGSATISAEVLGKKVEYVIYVKEPLYIEVTGDNFVWVGDSISLNVNTNVEGEIVWSSSDEEIAKVDNLGVVTGFNAGTAIIYAESLGKKAEYVIEVKEALFLEVTGDKFVGVGNNIDLNVNTNIEGDIKWTSSDDSIATVENGKITGLSEGEATIKIEINDISFEHTIKVFDIIINGTSSVYVENIFKLEVLSDVLESVILSVSDEELATIDNDGNVTALKAGKVIVYATAYDYTVSYEIEIKEKIVYSIVINEKTSGSVGDTFALEASVEPFLESYTLIYSSSDDDIISVSNDGYVTLLSEGFATIKVVLENDETVYAEFTIQVKAKNGIVCDTQMMQGSYNYLKFYKDGEEVTDGLTWKVNDSKLAIVSENIMLGVNKGTVTVTCQGNNIDESIDVTINQYISEKPSDEDLARVEEILSNMTLNQKIGQMFVIGFTGTTIPSVLYDVINEYNFGNVIYMGYNVTSPSTLASMSNGIQDYMVEKNGVPAFICTDQEGGRVARLTTGATHFISNMTMAATNDYNNTYLEGVAMGKELRNYGINVDFAPVLDVNNNPENPIIGIRSYSDNPLKVGLYGLNMFTGLQSSNVMGCSKHFPGHGNTSTDSHYGLPQIDSSKEELYQTELAPFISSIANGIDSIMTTHIVFSAIDKNYPATLSKKVLTDLLRNELGFDGLIITDGMEMQAVTNNFGTTGEIAVKAVKAGVDILTYTSNNTPQLAHDGIKQAVESGEISEERINESVRRILLKKLKYGILDDYTAPDENISEMLAANDELNLKFAMDGLTQVRGTFNKIDKSKKVLIISPTTTYDLGSGLNSNSFANYASNYLNSNGYNSNYEVVSTNIKNNDANSLVEKAKNYDVIVVAMSNVKTSGYTRSANFVNSLAKLNKELIVIALDTPYDILAYSGVNNYICVYGYQKATVVALSKYLNGEFEAKGVCPIEAVK